ncbi:MAG: PSD1 domain-containing protein [Acidobacteria bacterium]|nr:PSD1 domain-containing protein [Acidobacteriota bacterium]
MWMVLLLAGLANAADEAALQILDANCASCHGAAKMGGLDLRDREGLLRGGSRGPAVKPGDAAGSLLYQAVLRKGAVQMPPGKKGLSDSEIAVLREWIDGGAKWSGGGLEAAPSWWSFRKVVRPAVPKNGAANAVDAFVMAKLAELKLTPVGRADRRTLIRRATFDLHGLPPSAAEVEAFVNDSRAGAYERLIERLLESPRYGERWGRHWLDVVRYADTGGFETDIYFPNAWRYRDYVIQAFQSDKPYDRFVQEQVAGDELFPGDLDLEGGFQIPEAKRKVLDAKIATGMYTIGPAYHEAALFGGQVRYEWLTDVVDTTGEAFLGLTLGCSRCHNHKFDPLTQRDYHSMMAVFAGSEEREIPVISKFNIFGFKSGYPSWLAVEELKGAVQRIDGKARKRVVDQVRGRFGADVLAAFDAPVEKRTAEQRALAAQLEGALTQAGLQENAEGKVADIPLTKEESAERERLIVELGKAAMKANPVMQTATVLGHAEVVPDVYVTHRGDWRSRGDKVGPAFPAALAGGKTVRDEPEMKLQRRKSLALWLTDGEHPLTARVMVNRVWQWHFGRGIVATPNDFGRQGEEPTHRELLDYLASEFVAQGWSVKKLHRLIMLSETYQRAGVHVEANARVDANNRYLWRMNRQRLDAEALRDSVLAASGELNLKQGGRPVIPKLSEEEYSVLWSRSQWPEALDEREHARRSVYLYVKRTFPLPMLSTFDLPDNAVSCARRDATTVAPQALTLMNGDFMVRQAERMARSVIRAGGGAGEWVEAAWLRALQRKPTAEERGKALGVVKDEGSLARLCLVILNLNEFLYVD